MTSPSPSSNVTSRGGRPRRLPIDVAATASGGLMTAPSAIAAGSDRSGSSQYSSAPLARAEMSTSTTDNPVIALRLRRKSTSGTVTALEYRIGGSTAARMSSGGNSKSGTPGTKLATIPTTTRINGAATASREAKAETATTTRMPTTPRIAYSIRSP